MSSCAQGGGAPCNADCRAEAEPTGLHRCLFRVALKGAAVEGLKVVGWTKSRKRGFFITPLILFSLSKEEGPQLIVDEEGGSLLTHFFLSEATTQTFTPRASECSSAANALQMSRASFPSTPQQPTYYNRYT